MNIEPFLYLAALLFALGIYGFLTRREVLARLAALQVATHGALIALVALGRGAQSGRGSDAEFADAFGVLVVALLCLQAVVGTSLALGLRAYSKAADSKAAEPQAPPPLGTEER